MTLTMDKDFTPVSRVKETKEHMKEFKTRYTEKDLLIALTETLRAEGRSCLGLEDFQSNILSCNVEAWYHSLDQSRFYVKMDVKNLMGYFEISFFTSIELEINTDKKMIGITFYKRDCDLTD